MSQNANNLGGDPISPVEVPVSGCLTRSVADLVLTGESRESGDARSDLEAIFRIRRPEFIRFLAKFGVDAVDAEDITQEVFLRMYEPDRATKQPERPYEWLLACARNLAINRFRRGCREIQVVDNLWKKWERTLPDPGCDTEGACIHRERCRKLARAIASLEPEEQQCILLRSDGVTFRQIGETLQLSTSRVVYLTRLATEKLHAAMQRATL